jgi:DNA-binding NtrC family response regulator
MQTNLPTILVVDDEIDVLDLTATYLRTMGYPTLIAIDGCSALSLLADHPEVELLLTDILMPGDLNGIELGERFTQSHPHAQVIYTTGYPAGSLTWNKSMLSHNNMLVKPFRLSELLMLIERLLPRKTSNPKFPSHAPSKVFALSTSNTPFAP